MHAQKKKVGVRATTTEMLSILCRTLRAHGGIRRGEPYRHICGDANYTAELCGWEASPPVDAALAARTRRVSRGASRP